MLNKYYLYAFIEKLNRRGASHCRSYRNTSDEYVNLKCTFLALSTLIAKATLFGTRPHQIWEHTIKYDFDIKREINQFSGFCTVHTTISQIYMISIIETKSSNSGSLWLVYRLSAKINIFSSVNSIFWKSSTSNSTIGLFVIRFVRFKNI